MALRIFVLLLVLLGLAECFHPVLPVGNLSACIRCDLLAEINSKDTIPPVILQRTPPIYPVELLEEGIMGRVTLEITVLPDSTIGYIEIKQSVSELDSLAIATVSEWSFLPALRADEPVIGFLEVDLDFFPAEIPEDLVIDDYTTPAFSVDMEELRPKIDSHILKQQEPRKHSLHRVPLFFYYENYHLISWQRKQPYLTLEGFSLPASQTTPLHRFQNYYPFYDYQIKKHHWKFKMRSYELPVTFIEAYLGLGFMEMDYGHLTLAKNDTFNVKDLQVYSTLFFQDGYWMGVYEKSSNFSLSLRYPIGSHSLLWSSLLIKQDIPATKLNNKIEQEMSALYQERISDHFLIWENPYLNAGIRYEDSRYKRAIEETSAERELMQLMLNRSFQYLNHTARLSWERIIVENLSEEQIEPQLTGKQSGVEKLEYDYLGDRLTVESILFSGLSYDYFFQNDLQLRLTRILHLGGGALVGSLEKRNLTKEDTPYPVGNYLEQKVAQDIYASLRFGQNSSGISIRYGKMELEQISLEVLDPVSDEELDYGFIEQTLSQRYIELEHQLTARWQRIDWTFSGINRYGFKDGLDYLPVWSLRNNLEGRLNLPHNNAITAGLIHHYTSSYNVPSGSSIDQTGILDGYIRISLTPLFDIQADAKNLLQEDSAYGYPIAGTHWNVGIRWFFFN